MRPRGRQRSPLQSALDLLNAAHSGAVGASVGGQWRQWGRGLGQRGDGGVRRAGDVKGGLACGGDGVAERVAHHRDTLGVLARGRQVAGNPVRADFDLAAASPIIEMASCTARPTSIHSVVHTATVISLISWASSRPGVVAYGKKRDLIPEIPAQGAVVRRIGWRDAPRIVRLPACGQR